MIKKPKIDPDDDVDQPWLRTRASIGRPIGRKAGAPSLRTRHSLRSLSYCFLGIVASRDDSSE